MNSHSVLADFTRSQKCSTVRDAPQAGRGVTLIELLVALAVIALLMALILPAVQQARSASRRAECLSHFRQLGIAIHSYHDLHSMFPPGNVNAFSLYVHLLPQLDQKPLYDSLDFSDPSTAANATARATQLGVLLCPADGFTAVERPVKPCNYVGNEGTGIQSEGTYNGFFQPLYRDPSRGGGPISARDIVDGLSQTVAFSEVLIGDGTGTPLRTIWDVPTPLHHASEIDQFADACAALDTTTQTGDEWGRGGGWMYGDLGPTLYNHVQTPNNWACTNATWVPGGAYPPVSFHAGGVNVCFGDGSSRRISEFVDRRLWRAIGSRGSGEVVSRF